MRIVYKGNYIRMTCGEIGLVQMSLIWRFAIRNELLYSGFVLTNVQIFVVQKISFATFGVSIDDFFTRYTGLGYSLLLAKAADTNKSMAFCHVHVLKSML